MCVRFSPDGSVFAAGLSDGAIRVRVPGMGIGVEGKGIGEGEGGRD